MRYLRVKNWKKFQYDADKQLPWIKFFTALLAPTKEPWYAELPDHTKALLHHIWLMAMVFQNRIPETWLTKEKLNLQSKVNIDSLLQSGSIWFEDEHGTILQSSRARDAQSGLSISQSLGSNQGEREGDSSELVAALVSRGLKIPPAKRLPLAKWPAKYGGISAILAAFDENSEAVLIADRPLQYLAAILRNRKVPQQPVSVSDALRVVEPEEQWPTTVLIDRVQAFNGTEDDFAKEFGFSRDEWRAYMEHYRKYGESEPIEQWLRARRTQKESSTTSAQSAST